MPDINLKMLTTKELNERKCDLEKEYKRLQENVKIQWETMSKLIEKTNNELFTLANENNEINIELNKRKGNDGKI